MFIETTQAKQNLTPKVPAEELYGLPVDTSVMFSDHKGIYKRRIETQQRKLLAKLFHIAPFLGRSEKILFIFNGCSPTSAVEQMLTGTFLHPLKRSLFVLTDRRILHIPTAINRSYRNSIAQIVYTDCRQLRIRGSTLIAKYKSGRKEKFPCIAAKGRKKVRTLIKNTSLEGRATLILERTHLCPRCTRTLIKNYYACPNCSLPFKRKLWAAALSIIFPGGGYFYTRHPYLGLLDALMEIFFASLLTVLLIAFGLLTSPDHQWRLLHAIIVCSTILVLEKLSTIMFSCKSVEEFIPKERFVDVLIEQTPARRSTPEPEDALSINWRSR